MTQHDIQDLSLADLGCKKIEWADRQMGVLRQIRQDFQETTPLKNQRIGLCMHVTAETASLARTLKAGGAEVALCACNPLSTQDDVAAALVKEFEIPVFAKKGADNTTYYKNIDQVLDLKPHIVLDNGADLISELHKYRQEQMPDMIGGLEETATGLVRLNGMARQGILKFPVVAVNKAQSKRMFDNRYGTGQSTIDSLMRSTNILLAGKQLVVVGYGWCGKGIAIRARGMGAVTTVVEVNPIKALEAVLDGFNVMTMSQAAEVGDVFITATGDLNVISRPHFESMRDGAILCNSGHFNSEIEIPALEEMSESKVEVRPYVHAYHLPNKRIYLLAEGRLVNLSCAEGHPAAVMDMSFSNQALMVAYLVEHKDALQGKVYPVSSDIDEKVARLKLKSMGIEVDTARHENYLHSWELGT